MESEIYKDGNFLILINKTNKNIVDIDSKDIKKI